MSRQERERERERERVCRKDASETSNDTGHAMPEYYNLPKLVGAGVDMQAVVGQV